MTIHGGQLLVKDGIMNKIGKIAVIGAGVMGAGIAAAIFRKGMVVTLYDVNKELLQEAVDNIKKGARRNLNVDHIIGADSLEEALKGVDLVIEAVVENMDLKKKIFAEVDKLASSETILASNTSSLSISEMASATNRPDKFVGLHFFNPAVIMRLVEVITIDSTSSETYEKVKTFIDDIRKTGVKVKESPGFVVNRILLPLVNEAFYLLEEMEKNSDGGVIETALDIDTAMERANVLLMGPFNLVDMIGLDTAYKVAEIIYEGLDRNDRYKPSSYFKKYYDNGFYGRKAGRGVYYYNNKELDPDNNPNLDENKNSLTHPTNPKFPTNYLVACMVNEGFRLLEEGIVDSYQDVETCIELGARWPKGPFAKAKDIGMDVIRSTLEKRAKETGGNARYQPSRLLYELNDELKEFFDSEN